MGCPSRSFFQPDPEIFFTTKKDRTIPPDQPIRPGDTVVTHHGATPMTVYSISGLGEAHVTHNGLDDYLPVTDLKPFEEYKCPTPKS